MMSRSKVKLTIIAMKFSTADLFMVWYTNKSEARVNEQLLCLKSAKTEGGGVVDVKRRIFSQVMSDKEAFKFPLKLSFLGEVSKIEGPGKVNRS